MCDGSVINENKPFFVYALHFPHLSLMMLKNFNILFAFWIDVLLSIYELKGRVFNGIDTF